MSMLPPRAASLLPGGALLPLMLPLLLPLLLAAAAAVTGLTVATGWAAAGALLPRLAPMNLGSTGEAGSKVT